MKKILKNYCHENNMDYLVSQPNPTKLTDSRADKYIKKFGKTCWEVDALNPQTLTSIVEENINEIIDIDQYNTMLDEENAGIQELKDFINSRNL